MYTTQEIEEAIRKSLEYEEPSDNPHTILENNDSQSTDPTTPLFELIPLQTSEKIDPHNNEDINQFARNLVAKITENQIELSKKTLFAPAYHLTKIPFDILKEKIMNIRPGIPIVYAYGTSNHGKTSLVSALLGEGKNTGSGLLSDTSGPEVYHSEQLIIIDTKGMNCHEEETAREQLLSIQEQYPCDAILLVCEVGNLRADKFFQTTVKGMMWFKKQVESSIKKVPVLPVFTKIDTISQESIDQLNFSDESAANMIENARTQLTRALKNSKHDVLLKILSKVLKIPLQDKPIETVASEIVRSVQFVSCNQFGYKPNYNSNYNFKYQVEEEGTVVTKLRRTIGIDNLKFMINSQLIADGKFIREICESEYKYKRRVFSTLIVTAFVCINSAISTIPVLDIPLTVISTNSMIDILSVFSNDSSKTAATFKKINAGVVIGTNICRSALFAGIAAAQFVGGAALSAVGLTVVALGAGAVGCAAVSAVATTVIGQRAYAYFTKQANESLAK